MNKLPNLDHLTETERQALIQEKMEDLMAHILACPCDEQLAWGQTLITSSIHMPLHAALTTGDTGQTEGLPLDQAIFTACNRAVVRGIEDLRANPKFAVTSAIRATLKERH